VKKDFSVF